MSKASPRAAARARAPRASRPVRRRLCGVVATGAALAALSLPAFASAAANPLTFDYSNSTAISAYAHPTGAVVVGRNFNNPGVVDQVQNGGGEVYQYVNVIDGFWETQATATGEQLALYGGPHNNPAYVMKPKRYNWADTPMMDMSPGSPWILHAVDHIKQWFPTTHAKGIFLDVVGERLWSGAWSQMSASERATWTAGNRDFVHRLRVAMGPSVIIVANNIWANGNPELNGITVEHHSFSEASYWGGMLGRSDWAAPTRNMVIANSTGEANSWANVAGVTHVSAQSTYGGPAAPIRAFSPLPGTGTSQPPAPTPPPDPTPTPTPPPSEPAPTPAPPPASTTILAGNLLANPSFESATTGWGSWQGALSAAAVTGAPDGAKVAQVRFSGSGSSYTIGDFPGRVTASANGARYTAQAYVRSGSSSAVGKPVTLFLRERSAGGATVQQVHGVSRTLANGFQVVTASITARNKGDRIDVFAAQDRASAGNVFQIDSISMAPLS